MNRFLSITLFAFFILFSVSGIPVFAQTPSTTGNINLFLGAKALDEAEWRPAHEHGEFALKMDFRPASWPVNLALDFRGSASGKETDVHPSLGKHKFEVETSEFNFGFRKIWEHFPLFRPFVGGGFSLAKVKSTRTFPGSASFSESDKGLGIWFGGGVYWTLLKHLNLGLEMMVSTAEVKISGVETDAGGGHFGFLAGYHW